MAKDIKQRIVLEGEAEYRKALSDARRNVKLLGSDLKAQSKAFDENGKAIKNDAERMKTLRQQYQAQKQVVDLMTTRLAAMREKYGENSREVQNFEINLNRARQELGAIGAEIGKTNDGGIKLGEVFQSAGKKAGDALKTLSATAGVAFAGLVAGAKTAVTAIDGLERSTGARADDLLTRSQQSGVGVVDIQAWEYAGRFVDTSADSILDSIKRLRRSMTSEQTQMDIGSMLGINVRGADGMYKDAQTLFFEIAGRINQGIQDGTFNPHGTEEGNLLQALFGKGYDDLGPLLEGLGDWEKLVGEAKQGLVMDEDTVSQFGQLDDLVQKLDATRQAISETVAEFFLPDWTALYTDINGVATAFNSFLKGEDGSEESLGNAVKKMFDDATTSAERFGTAVDTAIESMKASDNEDVQALGGVLDDLRNAMQGIVDNKDTVISALELIATVFISGKMAEAATTVSTLVTNLHELGMIGAIGATAGGALVVGAAYKGLEAVNDAIVERQAEKREEAETANTGRYAVEDPAAAMAAAQAYADMYARSGAFGDQKEWRTLSAGVYDAFGDGNEDAARDLMRQIEEATTVGGGAWQIPDDWFGQIGSGVESSVSESVASALDGEFSIDVQANVYGLPTVGGGPSVGTPHATGLLDVPYDGYPAILHKGETVLTREQGQRYRTGVGRNSGGMSNAQVDRLARTFAAAMGGVAVSMDGRAVGTLVAPTISEVIARQVMGA